MVKQSLVAVHFYSFELPDLWPWYFACVWVMTIANWDWKSRLTFPVLTPQKHHLGRERAFSNLTHKMWRRQETCGYSGKQRVMNGSRRGQWKLTWSVCRRSCTDVVFLVTVHRVCWSEYSAVACNCKPLALVNTRSHCLQRLIRLTHNLQYWTVAEYDDGIDGVINDLLYSVCFCMFTRVFVFTIQ